MPNDDDSLTPEDREKLRSQYDFHRQHEGMERTEAARANQRAAAHRQIADGLRQLHPWLAPDQAPVRRVYSSDSGQGQDSARVKEVKNLAELARQRRGGADTPETVPPRGVDAIIGALKQMPVGYWTAAAIHVQVVQQGWETDDAAGSSRIRAGINRAVHSGVVRRRRISRPGAACRSEICAHPSDGPTATASSGGYRRLKDRQTWGPDSLAASTPQVQRAREWCSG